MLRIASTGHLPVASRPLQTIPLLLLRPALVPSASSRPLSTQQTSPPPSSQETPPPSASLPHDTTKHSESLPAASELSTTASSSAAPPQPQPPTSISQPPPLPKRKKLPYVVTRTPSRNLAVYQDAKRGGNYKLTLVKKVWGDVQVLRQQLVDDLALPKKEVTVNQVTGHISIRGWHKDRVTAWLQEKGF